MKIEGLMSEHIYGVQYTFTVYPKTISELVSWVAERLPEGELQLYLCNSIPGQVGLHVFGSAVIHVDGGVIVEDSVNFTGKFWDVGDLSLYLVWHVNQYVFLGSVRVRYPVLRVYVNDEFGSRLSGVEVKATLSASYWEAYYGLTDANGVAVIDIINGSEPLNVYARKAGYDMYPDWTYLGRAPAPWVKGGDVEISGVLHYTGAQPPPPVYITVTVRVFHAYTKQPIQGATVTLDSLSKTTDVNGKAIFMDVQGGRDVKIEVRSPGFGVYSATITLPASDVEVGVGLIPKVIVELKLSVDRSIVNEGEEVVFTGVLRVNGQPSTETVELVEVLPEMKYNSIAKFTGDFTYRYRPPRGIHSYAVNTVIYNVQYWSNIVTLEVKAPAPTPIPGYANVYVHVHDALTREPLAGAIVKLDGREAVTGGDGIAIFTNIAGGRYGLRVEKSMYLPRAMAIEVQADKTVSVDVGMIGGLKQGVIACAVSSLTALIIARRKLT